MSSVIPREVAAAQIMYPASHQEVSWTGGTSLLLLKVLTTQTLPPAAPLNKVQLLPDLRTSVPIILTRRNESNNFEDVCVI